MSTANFGQVYGHVPVTPLTGQGENLKRQISEMSQQVAVFQKEARLFQKVMFQRAETTKRPRL